MSAFLRLMGRFIASVTNPSVCAACLMLLFSASTVLAEVTVEVSIRDRSFPAKPRGSSTSSFDMDEGGRCARAFKVIGEVTIRMKAPATLKQIGEKLNEIEPELSRAGADGIVITSVIVHEFTPAGFMDSGTTRAAIIHFTDEPRIDSRTEAEFAAMFRAKSNLLAFEGIWVDQLTKERVAFFEDPAQKGHFLGVQFDVANQKHVPPGLVVADLRLQEEGWLTGYVIFDDFTRYDVKMRMPAGDEFEIPIKKCTNGPLMRAYPDRFPPEYQLMKVKYVRQGSK
jgi:hypothetical protein